ncbi:MAG: hypothetical protein JSR58_00145 [Verrucomicrobia bacterium]|nr:hypothetical protein [Verrucomicrobiota bacterium]
MSLVDAYHFYREKVELFQSKTLLVRSSPPSSSKANEIFQSFEETHVLHKEFFGKCLSDADNLSKNTLRKGMTYSLAGSVVVGTSVSYFINRSVAQMASKEGIVGTVALVVVSALFFIYAVAVPYAASVAIVPLRNAFEVETRWFQAHEEQIQTAIQDLENPKKSNQKNLPAAAALTQLLGHYDLLTKSEEEIRNRLWPSS